MVKKKTEMKSINMLPGINKCEYDAQRGLIEVDWNEGRGSELYLPVNHRVQWFLSYCSENNLTPMIDESEIHFYPEMQLVTATVRIYINGELRSTSIASKWIDGTDPYNLSGIVQSAATAAKGRALANMGFSSLACAPNEEGDGIPVDAGFKMVRDANNPMLFHYSLPQEMPQNTASQEMPQNAAPQEMPQNTAPQGMPQVRGVMADEGAGPAMTVEQARLYRCPIGKYKGLTMAEIMGQNERIVKYYAANASIPELAVAAQEILKAAHLSW